MSLTKDMIMHIDEEIQAYDDKQLVIYNTTYTFLNEKYPNSFYSYRITASKQELLKRGLIDETTISA